MPTEQGIVGPSLAVGEGRRQRVLPSQRDGRGAAVDRNDVHAVEQRSRRIAHPALEHHDAITVHRRTIRLGEVAERHGVVNGVHRFGGVDQANRRVTGHRRAVQTLILERLGRQLELAVEHHLTGIIHRRRHIALGRPAQCEPAIERLPGIARDLVRVVDDLDERPAGNVRRVEPGPHAVRRADRTGPEQHVAIVVDQGGLEVGKTGICPPPGNRMGGDARAHLAVIHQHLQRLTGDFGIKSDGRVPIEVRRVGTATAKNELAGIVDRRAAQHPTGRTGGRLCRPAVEDHRQVLATGHRIAHPDHMLEFRVQCRHRCLKSDQHSHRACQAHGDTSSSCSDHASLLPC